MTKKLGIDLGSSSLGWFLRESNKIINNGVIIFKTGMVKDKGGGYSSPTKDRRNARSKRRLIQARKYRKWELLEILIDDYVPLQKDELENWSKYKKGIIRKFPESESFLNWLACDFTYEGGTKYKNPYELRVKAIDNKLSKHELGRVLYHLIQRRGYKNIGEKDNETKKQIARRGESGFKSAMEKNRTIAEALSIEFLAKGERARNQYPYRIEYEAELLTIFKSQGFDISQNERGEYIDDFVRKVRKAIIWQRPLRSQKGNIGKCSLEPSKPRCPVSHPIFEIFRAWQFINSIKAVTYQGDKHINKEEIPLEFKQSLFDNIFIKKGTNFKFDVIQKYLDKLFQEKKEYNYLNKSTLKYDSSVSGMPVCKGLIELFGDKVKKELAQLHTHNIGTKDHKVYNNYSVYDLWHLIFETDDDHLEDFAINKLGKDSIEYENKKGEKITENPIVKFKNRSFSTSYSDLSIKAMCKIIPFLKEGFLYNNAVLLAKVPELYNEWKDNKKLIYDAIKTANVNYSLQKSIVAISNNLIDRYKALKPGDDEMFAYKDYSYKLDENDLKAVKNACILYFGEKSWNNIENKKVVIEEVKKNYQNFFADTNRRYIELPTLASLIENEFLKQDIKIDGDKLYHHSNRKNLYPAPVYSKKYEKDLLAIPYIDSIKNPMFNKSMSILRKLINELLIQEYTDEDGVIQAYIDNGTEIIIEVARELNDNNKRIAIEKFQQERREKREKYRQFINEFKESNTQFSNIDTEDKIPVFEMWIEQTFEIAYDEKGNKTINRNIEDIRKEKEALKRYELWIEQKGQCMYTGRMISITQLFSNEIEIEHTIPRSLLPDNTMANQTICFSRYNSDIKNNRIPKECPNYDTDEDFPEIGYCSSIEPRLKKWKQKRDHYKKLFEDRRKPSGPEDEAKKNDRIIYKHYYRMHFEYWKDKVDRFTTDEIKDNWVRRQLTDTQMVSKYAREYLKTYFKKVVVQKGSTTADFRKIFGFQGEEKKNRSKHTHHSIDAAVLTFIPTNSSKRMQLLQRLYNEEEHKQKITRQIPFGYYKFNAQEIIDKINNSSLIVNYHKDKITEQTYKNVRKRGRIQYLKDKSGKYILDENGKRNLLKSKGTSIRGDLFQQTYLGKIRNVERDENGKPKRNDDNTWRFKSGKYAFIFTKRKKIEDAKMEDIIDPDIKKIIQEQLEKGVDIRNLKDFQEKTIRRVRVKTKTGKKVKDRINFKSKHDYKNAFYSISGEVPYAVFLTNSNGNTSKMEMIPVAIHEVAQVFKDIHKFEVNYYLEKFHPVLNKFADIKLLKIGQRVLVLKDDDEHEKRKSIEFQVNRLYKITQFSEGNIWLKYHLEARDLNEIKKGIKKIKSDFVLKFEKEYNLHEIKEDESIEDKKKRKKDFEDKMFKFSSLNDYRLKRLVNIMGLAKVKELKKKLSMYKAFSSVIELEGETPLLKTSQKNWTFLFEGYDFVMDIKGEIKWNIEENS